MKLAAENWILVSHEAGAGRADDVRIPSFPCLIGRQARAAVRIFHPTVSNDHAEISAEENRLFLRDLGSRNGTFLNGRRIAAPELLSAGDLLQFGERIFRLECVGGGGPSNYGSSTCAASSAGDLALAVAQVERLLSENLATAHFQPIVWLENNELHAYEALARATLFGVERPDVMFKAASYLNQECELSRVLRSVALTKFSPEQHVFLNTHPREMGNIRTLVASLVKLRKEHPSRPLTLEIHEAAVVDQGTMKVLRLALDDLQIHLAFDDFGAGQARLVELAEARPHYVKFDLRMIRGIDVDSNRRRLIASLIKITKDLGASPLAEGIETEQEYVACRELGFVLGQGYLFGKPAARASTGPLTMSMVLPPSPLGANI